MYKQKEVKDNSKFEFDKEIYLDLFLNINMERSNKHRAEIDKCKNELRKAREDYENLTVRNDIVQKFQDCEQFMKDNQLPPSQ